MVKGTRAGSDRADRDVRVGIIGTGSRGRELLQNLLGLGGVTVPALYDAQDEALTAAQAMVVQSGQPRPERYTGREGACLRLLERDDLDAILIATPWESHASISIAAMKAGKCTACEVPIALTVEECWELVRAHEQTRVPCMMLENWSFRRDNLAVLNMIREGLFGEMVHCHCSHSHDCISHWYWDAQGNPRWAARFLEQHNRDQYPTHSLGPVLSWMDINCGDAFAYLTSTAAASLGINRHFERTLGRDHPLARAEYAQGDIVTTVVKTHRGRTIVINNDMQLPRPYDNRWLIQGTLGLYDEERSSVYMLRPDPSKHEWEPFGAYQEKYDHRWWRERPAEGSHSGVDALQLALFVEAVRERKPLPLDLYDSLVMSVIIPLSEQSIARGSAPVECPDFTRGAWKTRKPYFAL